jgi:HK97 family phage prohead protease
MTTRAAAHRTATSGTPRPPPPAEEKAFGYLHKTEGAGPLVFRISSEVVDRHGDRVKQDGLKTENHARNPVLLWNHQHWEPAIGTAKVYRGADGAWYMEPAFDGIGELSETVKAKVEAGTLRTCSIGFRVIKYAFNEEGGFDIEEAELTEVSITNVQANPDAERVKNHRRRTDMTTPKSGEKAKTLEEGDIDAIRGVVEEAMKGLHKRREASAEEYAAKSLDELEAVREELAKTLATVEEVLEVKLKQKSKRLSRNKEAATDEKVEDEPDADKSEETDEESDELEVEVDEEEAKALRRLGARDARR